MIVQLKQGKLRGIENKSVLSGKQYYSFLGIPYAKPPINDLRFQPAVPVENWAGIIDASTEGSDCMHNDFFTGELVGSEDCLFINVHTPEPPSEIKTLKPTMVFIHGGSFAKGSGSSKLFSPDYLVNYGVVFVSLNYRLHALGFLNMGIPDCTGNLGLKDQTLALKWVNENIEQFGGDPNNITLFGESAGSSSVNYHLISPFSKDLFQKAILQSGTALSPWAFVSNPIEMGFKLGRKLGFEGNNGAELVEYLKKKRTEEITKAANEIQIESKNSRFGACNNYPFIPSVELIKENAFISDHPSKLSQVAKPIPIIIGMNSKEGLFVYADSTPEIAEKLREDFPIAIKNNFRINQSGLVPNVADAVKKFYFGEKTIGEDTDVEITDLYTDLYFLKMYESFEFISKSNIPTYVYEFAYDGNLNILKKLTAPLLPAGVKGADHADEMGYLFYIQPLVSEFDSEDLKVIENMCRLWTNFAKTGNPTPFDMNIVKWKPSTIEEPRYLHISSDLKMMDGKINETRISFWEKIFRSVNDLDEAP